MSDFREGRITVLCNVNILVKGFDQPDVACILIAKPVGGLAQAMQIIGTRPATLGGQGKADDHRPDRDVRATQDRDRDSLRARLQLAGHRGRARKALGLPEEDEEEAAMREPTPREYREEILTLDPGYDVVNCLWPDLCRWSEDKAVRNQALRQARQGGHDQVAGDQRLRRAHGARRSQDQPRVRVRAVEPLPRRHRRHHAQEGAAVAAATGARREEGGAMKLMKEFPPYTDEAVKYLCDNGARFIQCHSGSKMPVGKGGHFDLMPPPDLVARWLKMGLHVGIEPRSLRCGVIDVDGKRGDPDPDAGRNRETARRIARYMGGEWVVGGFESQSGNGKMHVWLMCDTTGDAPIGKSAEGKPYMAGPTSMLFDRDDPYTAFDVRFEHSFVVVTHYIRDLADAYHARWKPEGGSPRWPEIIAKGQGGRKAKQYRKPSAWRTSIKMNPRLEEKLRDMNARYLSKLIVPAAGEGQYIIARDTGWKTGQEALWNPHFAEQAFADLCAKGLREERREVFWKRHEAGRSEATSPPRWLERSQQWKRP